MFLGNDIGILLAPFIIDLKVFSFDVVQIFYARGNSNFTLRMMIFYIFSNFHNNGNIFGYKVNRE